MTKFSLAKVVKNHVLDEEKLADALFPTAKYPVLAYKRVLAGKSDLSVSQLEILADFIGCSVPELYNYNGWIADDEPDEKLVYTKGLYTAKVNRKGAFISLYKEDKLLVNAVSNTGLMTLDLFFSYLDELIAKYDNE